MSSLILQEDREVDDGHGFIFRTISGNKVISVIKQKEEDHLRILKLSASLCSGCGVGCTFCFTNSYKENIVLKAEEICDQVNFMYEWNQRDIRAKKSLPHDELKISFKQMGDPLINPKATILAIQELSDRYQLNTSYVVSTSGIQLYNSFFDRLNQLSPDIRLQFSCHTTSDEERKTFIPRFKVMSLEEIAEVVNKWNKGRVTLNFVIMKGYTYSAYRIQELFHQDKVFIKLNYVDENTFTKNKGMVSADFADVIDFADRLRDMDYICAYRGQTSDITMVKG